MFFRFLSIYQQVFQQVTFSSKADAKVQPFFKLPKIFFDYFFK